MERQSPGEMADALGITSTTLTNDPLDEAYIHSLFAADPDDILQIPDTQAQPEHTAPRAATEKKPAAPAAKEPAKPAPVTPPSFVVDAPDFLDTLSSDQQPQAPQPDSKPEKDKTIPAAASQDTPPPGEGSTAPRVTDSALEHHLEAFAQELFQLGMLTEDEQDSQGDVKITTPEALLDRLTREKKKGAVQILENILSQFGPEYHEAFNAIYINGVHPRDYFTQAETVESLAELDLTKPENQKFILSRYYKTLGWDIAKINAKIEKLENYQDLEEEARDIHVTLLAKEKQALNDTQARKKEELARKADMEQQYQTGVTRILAEKLKARELDGIPLDEKTARELSGYMLQKKWQLGDQQISDYEKDILDLTRPENRELQIKVALLMHLLKTDPTLTRLQRKAVTSQTNNMFSFLQREQSTAKKQGRKTVNFFDD